MIVWNIDWVLVLTFVVSTLLPLLVAIVSTDKTSGKRKGVLLAVLALATTVLSGILEALTSGGTYDLGQGLMLALGVFAWSVASYFGIWRAKGSEGQPSIAEKITSNVGRTVTLEQDDDETWRRRNAG